MMRRAVPLLASSIPRHVWDPSRHNPNWADSYSTEISDRRQWPAKKWSIGLEPQTPTDWQNHSLRNLSYAYNAALRSCSTFPEMIGYYQEMKQRGVKVDLDTLNTLLTRAARYEKIQVDDIFHLFDEMVELGAKPDMATAETLHTVWEFSINTATAEWREVRRRHLIRIYNALAEADVLQYGQKDLQHLLAAQIGRYRQNLKSLNASLSPALYKKYISCIDSFELLLNEINNFLWEFVKPDHAFKEDTTLKIKIPVLHNIMKRPVAAPGVEVQLSQFEDADVCSVVLSAVERVVDRPMVDLNSTQRQRFACLALQSLIGTSGVFLTADLVAQLMDVVKYSPLDDSRERDAMRLLSNALRATTFKANGSVREAWIACAKPCDARVVGRYIAAREPWSGTQFAPQGATFPLFAAGSTATVTLEGNSDASSTETAVVETKQTQVQLLRTAAEVDLRWQNLWTLIERTGALTDPSQAPANKLEVFTGLASFLRHMFSGTRLNEKTDVTLTHSFAPGMTVEVCEKVFQCLADLRRQLDVFLSEQSADLQLAPELECWESMLVVLRGMMDFYVLNKRSQRNAQAAVTSSQESESFFVSVAELRTQLVEESRSRFDGRFRLLWLQEA
ncbi:Hypothetical protein, putative [Bodo saltans]|uniref:Uncharacterized protein n=1 Tax=Bodo saltans TaxID=75058 RepID=A0A0S4JZM2_BODSA|nr:Hypothetical protein, putative [Bodo saltans]|eukprot:CUG94036.1 Hypothetical protein, putative [Bodo saltans]